MENGEIYKLMGIVSQKIGAIQKLGDNKEQRFKFRKIDDIYNGVHDALADAGVFCLPKITKIIKEREVKTAKGGTGFHYILEIEFSFCAPDGSSVVATTWGEAIDYGDKCINKCMAIAHKYALTQVFTIPFLEIDDPDANSHQVQKTAPIVQRKIEAPIDPIDRMLSYFAKFNVTGLMLEALVKKPLDSLQENDINFLRDVCKRLTAGESFNDIATELTEDSF